MTAAEPRADRGEVTVSADGTFVYEPDEDLNGEETFAYRITDEGGKTDEGVVELTIQPTNDAPTTSDDTAAVDEDTQTTIDVIANDEDIDDSDELRVQVVEAPQSGSTKVTDEQWVVYEPDPNFHGSDAFVYQVCDRPFDPTGDCTGLADRAIVDVTVSPVNDAPRFVDPTPGADEIVEATEDRELDVELAAEDVEGDDLTFELGDAAPTAMVLADDNNISWRLKWDHVGENTVEVTVSDGAAETTRELNAVVDEPDSNEGDPSVEGGCGCEARNSGFPLSPALLSAVAGLAMSRFRPRR